MILVASVVLAATSACGSREGQGVDGSEGRRPKILVGHADDPSKLPPGVAFAPDRDAGAPDRVDRTPHVSDDPGEIAEVRARYAREVDELNRAALEAVRAGGHVFLEHEGAFRRRPERARAELVRLMTSDSAVPDAGRARAAYVLMKLGRPEGEPFLFDALRSDRKPLRAAALATLREWDVRPDFHDPERARRAVALLDDPDREVALAAARLCAFRKLPGTEAALVRLLQSGRAKDPRTVARELADVVADPASIPVVLAHLLRDRPERYEQWTGS